MGKEFSWSRYSYRTPAEVAGKVFEELDKTVGLTPGNLVDASRPEDAPLHPEFEWDDGKAAEAYRREQARLMISNLTITIEEQQVEEVRAYYSLEHGFRSNSGTYVSTIEIMSDSDKREILLEKAKKEMRAFRAKYGMLTELADVFREMDEIDKMEDENV